MRHKPNIIFVQCDSMDGRAMGCMGHPAMKRATPNLDRLASEGTLFSDTYTNNPIYYYNSLFFPFIL
jgi:arylsulfatase A-like enzyme